MEGHIGNSEGLKGGGGEISNAKLSKGKNRAKQEFPEG